MNSQKRLFNLEEHTKEIELLEVTNAEIVSNNINIPHN